MRPQKRWIAAAAVAVSATMTLSACGLLSSGSASTSSGNGNMVGGSDPTEAPMPTVSASTMSSAHGGLMEISHTKAGLILANPHGMTVYLYTGDKRGSGVSNCTGSCAQEWPPVAAPVRLPAGVTLPGPIGYIVRANGQHQVTVDGYPIYRYAGDMAPGDATGNGINAKWYVIKVKKSMSSTDGSGSGMSGSGGSGTSGSGSSGGGGW